MSVIEKKIAQNKGYNDALFVNEKNLAVETTSGNFFWIKGTNVFTPSIENGALPGIARNLIIKACKKNKISSNRVFDYFLTEANICTTFKLNFYS